MLQCENRSNCFCGACGSKHVTCHRFCRTNQYFTCTFFSQRFFDSNCFCLIIQRCTCTVSINVNMVCIQIQFIPSICNGTCTAFRFRLRCCNVISITCCTVSHNFCKYVCASVYCML